VGSEAILSGENEVTQVTYLHNYISTDGKVRREYKAGTASIDEWLDTNNKTTQTFDLTASGIANVQTTSGTFSPPGAITGNPTLVATDTPLIQWNFDEAEGNNTAPGGTINGHKSLWKQGVSGTALGFDGYFSSVNVPTAQAPTLGDNFTINTWVVIGAFPFGNAPIVHHSTGNGQSGYYLGLNEAGQAIFIVNGTQITTTNSLPLNTWVHVVGTYGGGTMEIYIDGIQSATGNATGAPTKPNVDLMIGLNNQQNSPTDPVFEPQTYPSTFGIEGLIDEVIIYNSKLTQGEIDASFGRLTDATIKANPDIDLRTLPGQSGTVSNFGAIHSRLSYHDLWDNMWRASEFEDVTIKFEDLPTSYVYWRGTTHGVNMVTENNLWMSDQSEEIFCGENGFPPNPSVNQSLSEHMSDKEARFSHIRVIENTPARVVVHWRYAVADLFFDQCDDRNFTDEYHTIYPDGTLYRTLRFWANGSSVVPSDIQPLTSPGLLYSDIVNTEALTVANVDGNSLNLNWSNGVPEGEDEILMANYKSNWKIYQSFPEGFSAGPWGATNQSARSTAGYAGPWNHWPVSRIVSDGRQAWDGDGRLHHFALSTGGGGSSIMYGFSNQGSTTTQNVTSVIPAVNGWRNSAAVSGTTGATSQGYNLDQREYNFTRSGTDNISFTLDGSSATPVYNPCFVISNWSTDAPSTLHVNGMPSTNFKQGVIYDTAGIQTLIIYVPMEATAGTTFTIAENQSSATDVLAFSLPEQIDNATIDATNHTVSISVAAGTNVSALTPTIAISAGDIAAPV
ncbi:MAG: LamG domain-containing protein, partial [Bacteroidota bacterium]